MVKVAGAHIGLDELGLPPVVERHRDLPVGDRSDLAGITVDDAQPPVVAASDDPIADGERTAVGRELVVGDPPE